MHSAGPWTTGIFWGRAPSPAIAWNAPGKSPAAILPIPAARISLISPGSAFRSAKSARTARSSSPRSQGAEAEEGRVLVAGRPANSRESGRTAHEVETPYTNGPAAGGGAWKSARDAVAVASVVLRRELASPPVPFFGSVA